MTKNKKKKSSLKSILKNNFQMIRIVWKYSKSCLILKIIVALLNVLIVYLQIYSVKWFFELLENRIDFTTVVLFVLLVGLAYILPTVVIAWINNVLQSKINLKLSERITLALIDKIKTIDYQCFENADFYDKYTKALAETNERAIKVTDTFVSLINIILSISVAISLIVTIEPFIIILCLLMTAFTFFLVILYNKIDYKAMIDAVPFQRRTQYVRRIIYQPEYAKEIKLFTNSKDVIKEIYNYGLNGENNTIKKHMPRKIAIYTVSMFLTNLIQKVIPWWYIAVKVLNHTMTIANASVLINVIVQITQSFSSLIKNITGYQNHSLYIDNLNTIMDYPSVIENDNGIILDPSASHDIEFKSVTFSYVADKPVLSNLSFKIGKGEKVAFVGYNGAGKSTIVKLLIRLYDVDSGEILIDGINIKEYNLNSLRLAFGLVFQDFNIYAMSFLQNVLLDESKDNLDEKKAEDALERSGLLYKIDCQSGINTMITKEFDDKGVYLSGGESQKLVLARVFAKDVGMIVLDEPSSSLDPISEHEMHVNMLKASEGKTVILISHRLSSVINSDRILFLNNGAIIENGSHSELMSQNGEYAKMFNMQSENYIRSKVLNKKEVLE